MAEMTVEQAVEYIREVALDYSGHGLEADMRLCNEVADLIERLAEADKMLTFALKTCEIHCYLYHGEKLDHRVLGSRDQFAQAMKEAGE